MLAGMGDRATDEWSRRARLGASACVGPVPILKLMQVTRGYLIVVPLAADVDGLMGVHSDPLPALTEGWFRVAGSLSATSKWQHRLGQHMVARAGHSRESKKKSGDLRPFQEGRRRSRREVRARRVYRPFAIAEGCRPSGRAIRRAHWPAGRGGVRHRRRRG
jgi:hypothetical protein